jgi:hypothetical protein
MLEREAASGTPPRFQCTMNISIQICRASQTGLTTEAHVASMYWRFRYGPKDQNLMASSWSTWATRFVDH